MQFLVSRAWASVHARADRPRLPAYPAPQQSDYTSPKFHFASGETLDNLRIHERTVGKPTRDASGHITNAVLVMPAVWKQHLAEFLKQTERQ